MEEKKKIDLTVFGPVLIFCCLILFGIFAFINRSGTTNGLNYELIESAFKKYTKNDNIKISMATSIEGNISNLDTKDTYTLERSMNNGLIKIFSHYKEDKNSDPYYVDKDYVYIKQKDGKYYKTNTSKFYNGDTYDMTYTFPSIYSFNDDAKYTEFKDGSCSVSQTIDLSRYLMAILDSDSGYGEFIERFGINTLKSNNYYVINQVFNFNKDRSLKSVEYSYEGKAKNNAGDTITKMNTVIKYSNADKIKFPFDKKDIKDLSEYKEDENSDFHKISFMNKKYSNLSKMYNDIISENKFDLPTSEVLDSKSGKTYQINTQNYILSFSLDKDNKIKSFYYSNISDSNLNIGIDNLKIGSSKKDVKNLFNDASSDLKSNEAVLKYDFSKDYDIQFYFNNDNKCDSINITKK